jgi:hypothetical protein
MLIYGHLEKSKKNLIEQRIWLYPDEYESLSLWGKEASGRSRPESLLAAEEASAQSPVRNNTLGVISSTP